MKLAVAQFEPKDGDKNHNLSIIEDLTQKAKVSGADAISFHEMSVTGVHAYQKPESGRNKNFGRTHSFR